jgi:AraC-like DNA-binding protein
LPTARATLYFAANVTGAGSSGSAMTGLFVEGPHASAFDLTSECEEMVAVKLRPGGLRALLGAPAREIRGATVPLRELWGQSAESLADEMSGAATAQNRATILQRELLRRCRAYQRHDVTAIDLAAIVERRAGRVRVGELIERSGYSQRALLEKFDEWLGLTPKQYARLTRLRSAIVRLLEKPEIDGAALALACGFCDQAHMIHEFRDLLDVSPRRFIEQHAAYSPKSVSAFGPKALPNRERQLYRLVGLVSRWDPLQRSRVAQPGSDS